MVQKDYKSRELKSGPNSGADGNSQKATQPRIGKATQPQSGGCEEGRGSKRDVVRSLCNEPMVEIKLTRAFASFVDKLMAVAVAASSRRR